MRIKRTKQPSGSVVGYVSDKFNLYVLMESKGTVDLYSFEAESFREMMSTSIPSTVNIHSEPCIDDDCIYIPTDHGSILSLDKFSGEVLATLNLGSMVVISNLFQTKREIITLCGLPLSGKYRKELDKQCISVNDKTSGKKLAQSQIMTGEAFGVSVDDQIYVLNHGWLYQYDLNCELRNKIGLRYNRLYPPIVTDNFIVCASRIGALHIFNKSDLTSHGRMFVERNSSPPIHTGNNILHWFAKDSWKTREDKNDRGGLHRIDLNNLEWHELSKFCGEIETHPVVCDDKIFVGNTKGLILSPVDGDYLQVSDAPMQKICVVGNNLFVASQDKLYQIEVNSD